MKNINSDLAVEKYEHLRRKALSAAGGFSGCSKSVEDEIWSFRSRGMALFLSAPVPSSTYSEPESKFESERSSWCETSKSFVMILGNMLQSNFQQAGVYNV
jgi:hypothetical protein